MPAKVNNQEKSKQVPATTAAKAQTSKKSTAVSKSPARSKSPAPAQKGKAHKQVEESKVAPAKRK